MQAGGVTTSDVYNISGRVIIDGVDIGAYVQSVSFDRDIPSGFSGDIGFTSSTGQVTAVWGEEVSDRVDHPWTNDPVWPPRPNARVEVRLSDGVSEWTQFKGVVVDPSGSTTTRVIRFGVRDNYRSLDRLITIPALSDSMPSLSDADHYRYIGMQSTFLTDLLLRAGNRYCTPPPQSGWVVSATMQGSTWPERGTVIESIKNVPDGGTESFFGWENTDYGIAAQNAYTIYTPTIWSGTPGGGRLTHHPFELTQEVISSDTRSAFLRARFDANGGEVALVHSPSNVEVRYYAPSGSHTVLLATPKTGVVRATARSSLSGSTLTAELRTFTDTGEVVSHGTTTHNVGDALNGVLSVVRCNGLGVLGAFQASFAPTPFGILDYEPNAVIHDSSSQRNSLVGVPPQIDANVLDLLNEQANAEFAQWWIDEHDVLQWWERGLLAQRRVVGALTGADHVKELSWSHDNDSIYHKAHVKYRISEVTHRWRTNLTLWEGNGDTLSEGDTSELFVNVPTDEIWLGVDWQNPARYARTNVSWSDINAGVRTVLGGIAVDEDGTERRTNSIHASVRKISDETYLFEHNIRALASSEQAALEFPSDSAPDSNLWSRWHGKGLPILRGKKRVVFDDDTYTSEITGDSDAPDYTHDFGWWIQKPHYAGLTADYAAASLTQPRPRIESLDIMPVFALQAGDRVVVQMPEVMGLRVDAVVTSISIDADLTAGAASQSIRLMPITFFPLGGTWQHFGAHHEGDSWSNFGAQHDGDTWEDFAQVWEGFRPPGIPAPPAVSWQQFGDSYDDDTWTHFRQDRDNQTWGAFHHAPKKHDKQ